MIKILVIEPNPQWALDLFRNLFFREAITIVENVAEALNCLSYKRFDVIFLSQAAGPDAISKVDLIVDQAKMFIGCRTAEEAIALLEEIGLAGVVLYPHKKQTLKKLFEDLARSDKLLAGKASHIATTASAIDITLKAIEESNSTGKYLLSNLPEVFQSISERIKYKNQLIASLACRLLPIGFTVLAPKEIDCIRALTPEDPYFQLAIRRAFFSASQLTAKIPLLRPISDCFRCMPFASGQLSSDREKDLPSVLYLSTIWTIGNAVGLSQAGCRDLLIRSFPLVSRKLKSALLTIPTVRCRESVIPFSRLKSAMVIKQELRFKAGALILSPDNRINDEVYQQIATEVRQNSTKNVVVALDSLDEADQREFQEVFYIAGKGTEGIHSRCEIVGPVNSDSDP